MEENFLEDNEMKSLLEDVSTNQVYFAKEKENGLSSLDASDSGLHIFETIRRKVIERCGIIPLLIF